MAAELKQLDKVVQKQEKAIQEQEWLKYHVLIDIAVKVLKKEGKRVLLYGGAAINSLLPKTTKFYDPDELIDLDVYTANETALFENLKVAYVKAGYPLVSVVTSIHKNTYKFQVDGMMIMDIHYLTKSHFNYLSKDSKVGDLGIRCASIDYLRTTFYKQLAEPLNARRWKKVFERLVLFNKVYPPKSHCSLAPVAKPSSTDEVYKQFYAYLKTTPYLLLAADVFFLAGGETKTIPSATPLRILVDKNEEDIVEEFFQKFPELKLEAKCTIYKDSTDGDIKVCTITLQRKPILYIYFTSDICYSYISYRGIRVASLPTLVQYYSFIAFIHYKESSNHLQGTECLIHLLIALHLKSLRSKTLQQRSLFQQFITDCYGAQSGLITRKRIRLVERLKEKYGESSYLERMQLIYK